MMMKATEPAYNEFFENFRLLFETKQEQAFSVLFDFFIEEQQRQEEKLPVDLVEAYHSTTTSFFHHLTETPEEYSARIITLRVVRGFVIYTLMTQLETNVIDLNIWDGVIAFTVQQHDHMRGFRIGRDGSENGYCDVEEDSVGMGLSQKDIETINKMSVLYACFSNDFSKMKHMARDGNNNSFLSGRDNMFNFFDNLFPFYDIHHGGMPFTLKTWLEDRLVEQLFDPQTMARLILEDKKQDLLQNKPLQLPKKM